MKRGFCDHKDKKSRIVVEWKCVDIRFPDNITADEKQKREKECRAKDYYGVCELCRWFIPDPDATVAVSAAPTKQEPTYTETKPKAAQEPDPYDSIIDEFI